MNKREALKIVESEAIRDPSLPLQESNFVFGEGDPDAVVCFVGEAPGFHENEQKRPFVGRGGQLLRKMIRDIGWKESDVYITNIVKRRPPENRDPLPEEIAAYSPYLARQIEIISPVVIVPLGRFSMNFFLPDAKITRDQGKIFKIRGRFIYPMFHPAAALRSSQVLEEFQKTFGRLSAVTMKCEGLLKKARIGKKDEKAV